MVKEEKLRRNNLYKVELVLLKLLPMTIALCYGCNSILSYFDIDVPLFSYIAGMSLLPIIFLYISSYVFRFCNYHRMFLHYIVLNSIVDMYDTYIGIPVDNRGYLTLHISLICITLFIVLYLYVKNNKKALA